MTNEEAIEVLRTYDMSEDNDDTEFKDAIAMAIKALEQEPKTDWIPVSEKLPESECLLCDNEGLIFIGSYLKHCKWFEDYDENIIDDVVAWMPLPEPYKESEDME